MRKTSKTKKSEIRVNELKEIYFFRKGTKFLISEETCTHSERHTQKEPRTTFKETIEAAYDESYYYGTMH